MSPRRVVLPPGWLARAGEEVALPEGVVRHLRVLRLTTGAPVSVTDGEGREADGLLRLDARPVVELGPVRSVVPPQPELILLQGIGKGEKLDQVVRQAVELGIARLVPVATERAVARREHKVDRLRAIAEDALRVSGRAHRATIEAPTTLQQALEVEADLKLGFVLGASLSLPSVLRGAAPRVVALLVGPEGGFSANEVDALEAAGFRAVHLGRYTLRTETAGPAAVAMVRYALELSFD